MLKVKDLNGLLYNKEVLPKDVICVFNLLNKESTEELIKKDYPSKKFIVNITDLKEFYFLINNYAQYLKQGKQLHIVVYCTLVTDYIPAECKLKSVNEYNNSKEYYKANQIEDGIINYALYKDVPIVVRTSTTVYRTSWVGSQRVHSIKEYKDNTDFYTCKKIDFINLLIEDTHKNLMKDTTLSNKIEALRLFGADFDINPEIYTDTTNGVDTPLFNIKRSKFNYEYTVSDKELFKLKLTPVWTDVDIARINQSYEALLFFINLWKKGEDLTPFFDTETTIICPHCGFPVRIVKDSKRGFVGAFGDCETPNCTITSSADPEETVCNGCGCKPLL